MRQEKLFQQLQFALENVNCICKEYCRGERVFLMVRISK